VLPITAVAYFNLQKKKTYTAFPYKFLNLNQRRWSRIDRNLPREQGLEKCTTQSDPEANIPHRAIHKLK
jgi:hypothetical protein